MPHRFDVPLHYTVDEWDDQGNSLVAIRARADHHDVALAAYEAFAKVCNGFITLRQKSHVIRQRRPVTD